MGAQIITNDPNYCSDALEALRKVTDPEIGLNIVDLGLTYQIDYDQYGALLFCRMTLTTRFCPMGESICDSVREVLAARFPELQIKVDLCFDPVWNPERISEEGRFFLNS